MNNSTLVWRYMDIRRYNQQFNTVSINVGSIKAKKNGNLKVLNSIRYHLLVKLLRIKIVIFLTVLIVTKWRPISKMPEGVWREWLLSIWLRCAREWVKRWRHHVMWKHFMNWREKCWHARKMMTMIAWSFHFWFSSENRWQYWPIAISWRLVKGEVGEWTFMPVSYGLSITETWETPFWC